jgi:hypothetical protein
MPAMQTLTLSIGQPAGGGYVLLDASGHPRRAFSTWDELLGAVAGEMQASLLGAAGMAARLAPSGPEEQVRSLKLRLLGR